MNQSSQIPLCVDLDGTLIRTDLLWEALLAYTRAHPFSAAVLPVQLLRGRAGFKQWLADRVTPSADLLPARESLVSWLREQSKLGRRIVLATASPRRCAIAVAQRFDFIAEVFATEGKVNLKGVAKAGALSKAFGFGGFDYVGNSAADIPVWAQARTAIVVDDRGHLFNRVRRRLMRDTQGKPEPTDGGAKPGVSTAEVVRAPVIGDTLGSGVGAWRRAIRLHQWLKNLLLAVPLVAAHRINDPAAVLQVVLGMLCFGLIASGAYVLNDLLDLEADRRHPVKRHRPFAAGVLSLPSGVFAGALLWFVGLALAATILPTAFLLVLALYLVMTCAYSLWLKRWAIVDVTVLAALYVIRVIAGGAVVDVRLSSWLLAFSLFLFFSLALTKRVTELGDLASDGVDMLPRRGYRRTDLPLLQMLGVSSGLVAVLVLALYINSNESRTLYSHPQVLWMLIPIILLWVSRLWLLAHRQQLHEDPVVYALSDPGSLALGAASVVTLVWAL